MKKNKPLYLDPIYKLTRYYNALDRYTTTAFNRIFIAEHKKKGLNIALKINFLTKKLDITEQEINKYLLYLYKNDSIILFSNKEIYLIRLRKKFINQINKYD